MSRGESRCASRVGLRAAPRYDDAVEQQGATSTSRWVARFVAVVLVGSLLGVASAWALFVMPLPFDRATWRACEEDPLDPFHRRHRMADRLVAQGTLVGRTRLQVAAMLGEPPPTGYFTDWDLVFLLGRERGPVSIDSEWLVLRFDERSRVAEAALVRD